MSPRSAPAAPLVAALFVALGAGWASRAEAACSGFMTPRWSAHQALALLLNPVGAEHNFRLGICVPLYDTDDDALELNLFEAGISTYVSPIYVVAGPYAQISPATFFFARAELHGMGIWPIPLPGAGYYAMSGYGDSFRPEDLNIDDGRAAGGWNVRLLAILRGVIDLGDVTLAGQDVLFADYQEVGDAAYYLNVRQDLVSARADWVIGNEASVLVGFPVDGGPELRIGAYDGVRGTPGGSLVHQLGAIAMAVWESPAVGIDTLSVFVRVGGYTHHPIRTDEATTLAVIALDHDLGPL